MRLLERPAAVPLLLIYAKVGSFQFTQIYLSFNHGLVPAAAATTIGLGILFGAMGKSAQFPLHLWLIDAMEAPAPAAGLVHAATMVGAGIYLVGRLFPILTPDARLFTAILGLLTLAIGARTSAIE